MNVSLAGHPAHESRPIRVAAVARFVEGGHLAQLAWAAGLTVVVGWLYWPALNFGLIWDDPLWLRQGVGQSVAALFRGVATYQFYRPLAILYYRLFLTPAGVANVGGLHAAQVAGHLVATLLCFRLAHVLTGRTATAGLTGLLFAVSPFNQQAVAWAGAHQPIATVALLAALSAFDMWHRGRSRLWLGLAYVAYAGALFLHETAVPMAIIFILYRFAVPHPTVQVRRFGAIGAWVPAFLAAAYALSWLSAPRLAGYASVRVQVPVLAYLLQAVAFPVARLLALWPGADWQWSALPLSDWQVKWPLDWRVGEVPVLVPLVLVIGLGLGAWCLACFLAFRSGHRAVAWGAVLWVVAALLPIWLMLDYDYVMLGPRLVYPALPAVCLVWALAIQAVWQRKAIVAGRLTGFGRLTRFGRVPAVAVAVWLVAFSMHDVLIQNRMYRAGDGLMRSLVQAQQAALRANPDPSDRLLFVNFPDRYRLRQPPFPMGYWGTPLAPKDVELSDYCAAASGRAARTRSRAVPATGAAARMAWPYAVDLRGVIVDQHELVRLADRSEGIYLTDYLPGGGLSLARVGALIDLPGNQGTAAQNQGIAAQYRGTAAQPALIARFGKTADLLSADIKADVRADVQGGHRLQLLWSPARSASADDTVFVHVLTVDGRQVAGADGDAWGGLLPMTAWPADEWIQDTRFLDTAGLASGRYVVTVGLYNRRSGQRLPALGADGSVLTHNEFQVGDILIVGR